MVVLRVRARPPTESPAAHRDNRNKRRSNTNALSQCLIRLHRDAAAPARGAAFSSAVVYNNPLRRGWQCHHFVRSRPPPFEVANKYRTEADPRAEALLSAWSAAPDICNRMHLLLMPATTAPTRRLAALSSGPRPLDGGRGPPDQAPA